MLAPIPAHGRTTGQLPAVPGTPAATLPLPDALGRAVRTRLVALPAAGWHHELGRAGIPAGSYALRVQAGGRSSTSRPVVE